jgi:hypothetical protein
MLEWLADLVTTVGVTLVVLYVVLGLADAFGIRRTSRL